MFDINTIRILEVDLGDARLDSLISSLSNDEIERSAKFYRHELVQAYQRCRGVLRHILGETLKRRPNQIHFAYGRYGKPVLAEREIEFNVTHSSNRALIALSHSPIGIDLESLVANIDPVGMAHMVFNNEERASLLGLPFSQQKKFFCSLWTRKEAYAKAIGLGLQIDFKLVGFQSVADGKFRVVDESRRGEATFYCYEVESGHPGFSACVCLSRSDIVIEKIVAADWLNECGVVTLVGLDSAGLRF
jgi:4'-phosphopantetheinyl transferase